jgi:Protein of unknown function (DUF3237)
MILAVMPSDVVSTIALVSLTHAQIEMADPIVLTDTPQGSRIVVSLLSGRFEGRLSGRVLPGAAADWVVVGADGSGCLDVRFVVQTDDGARLFVQCCGRVDLSPGHTASSSLLAMTFETGDKRYRSFNTMLALVRADVEDGRLRYTVYEVVAKG